MTFGIYVLRGAAWRFLAVFAGLEVVLVLLNGLQLARREPLLAGWAPFELSPIWMAGAAVPCALAAWTSSVAGNLAALEQGRELTAASAAGLGPANWLAPLLGFAVGLTAWGLVQVAFVFPATRFAKHTQEKLLLRRPEVCLRLLGTDPTLIPSLWIEVKPGRAGGFQDLWALEHDRGSLRGIWRAREGRVEVPSGRDVLRLELGQVRGWMRRGEQIERVNAAVARFEYPLRSLAGRRSRTESTSMRESTLGELHRQMDELPPGETRRQASAEAAARWAFALAPLSLLLAGAAIGLRCARWGPWGGTLAGLALVGALFFPLHSLCKQEVAKGLSPWLMALPSIVLCALAWSGFRRGGLR